MTKLLPMESRTTKMTYTVCKPRRSNNELAALMACKRVITQPHLQLDSVASGVAKGGRAAPGGTCQGAAFRQ